MSFDGVMLKQTQGQLLGLYRAERNIADKYLGMVERTGNILVRRSKGKGKVSPLQACVA